jgi:hypothetical protein
MARQPTMAKDILIAPGLEKLAALVLDEAGDNPAFKKMVAAALAGAKGPGAVAAIVDRRLASLARAHAMINWDKRKAFADDLKATVATITGELGNVDPAAALERLVRFLTMAGGRLQAC